MKTLRPYQVGSVESLYEHMRTRSDNPVVVLPTAAGKTPVIARVCSDVVTKWNGRAVVLSHVKELVDQAAGELRAEDPRLPVGVYSAGLNRRDLGYAITSASIQSIYKRAFDLGKIDLVLIDECHLIPPDGEGMYRTFLNEMMMVNPNVRVAGLTATAFRLKGGWIAEPENILNHVCYEVGVKELIAAGYISALKTKASVHKFDTSGLHMRGGEFVKSEVEDLVDSDDSVTLACSEIVALTQDRKAVLMFCGSVKHAHRVADELRDVHGVTCATVTGKTPRAERDQIVRDFKAGRIKYLTNVNVLTTGFNAPVVDCVVLLRPTASAGLYYQMCGRGFRLYPGKVDCLVLDYGENVARHGPVDTLSSRMQGLGARSKKKAGEAPAKECPECHEMIATGFTLCPECNYEFPPPNRNVHGTEASNEGIISGEITDEVRPVKAVYFCVHEKRNNDDGKPPTMRVDYTTGVTECVSEWVCFEHDGYAGRKARAWWAERSDAPVPATVAEAVDLCQQRAIAETRSVTVRSVAGERWPNIIGYDLGPKPDADGAVLAVAEYDDSNLPDLPGPNDPLDLENLDIPF